MDAFPQEISDLSKATILIVDDVKDNLIFLSKMLSIQGYNVRSAANGCLAIQSVEEKLPDLILLDIMMPDMDGYEVCQYFKSNEKTSNIPIIFISALSEPFDKVKAFQMGGSDYLTKPIGILEATARIEYQLKLCSFQKQLIDRNRQLEEEMSCRKKAEEARNRAMQEIANIKFALDQAAIVSITDAQGRITYANDQFCAISQYLLKDLIGQTHRIINSGYHSARFFQHMWQTIREGRVWKGEICNRSKDGKLFWVNGVIVPLLGTDGVPNEFVAVQSKVSDRSRAVKDKIRAALANWHRIQAEVQVRLLQSVVVTINDAVVITEALPINEPGPKIIYVNNAFTQMMGYQMSEVKDKTPRLLQGPKTSREVCSQIKTALKSLQPVRAELLNYRKDGSEVWIDLNITPLKDENGTVTHWIAVQRDITERKEVEQLLQQQAQIIEQIHDSVIITDLEGFITSFNKGAQQRFGYDSQEILGKNISVLCSGDQSFSVYDLIINPLLENQKHEVEISMATKAGEIFQSYLSLSILKNDADKCIGMICYCIDISHRKKAEEEILKSLEKERYLHELKTRFVSTVSHEYRTPLATILSSLELLEYYGHCSTEEEKKEYFQQMRLAIRRLTDMLNDVLSLNETESGKLSCNPIPLNLQKFIQDLVVELQQNTKAKNQIILTFKGNNFQVEMDGRLLRHIFSNLILNAIKYSTQESDINIEVEYREKVAVFWVRDQGIGIPEDSIQSLFQPFFRANNVGTIPGTGLGLSIVRHMVMLHGGTIDVQSQVGRGTSFRVEIPWQPSKDESLKIPERV